jgi:Putative auto-transporter adhesin, head GIN domain
VPELTGIEVSGSGDLEADGIDADQFELLSEGASDIALAGITRRLVVSLDGSGDSDLADLVARDARVRYFGEPAVTPRVDGSGDLTHAN